MSTIMINEVVPYYDDLSIAYISEYSRLRDSTILHPNHHEIRAALRSIPTSFCFSYPINHRDNTTLPAILGLRENPFPRMTEETDIKTSTWIKMIIAFNTYARLKQEFYNNHTLSVDAIGSQRNSYDNEWRILPPAKNALFLQDAIIQRLTECNMQMTTPIATQDLTLIESATIRNATQVFWLKIIDTYDSLPLVILNRPSLELPSLELQDNNANNIETRTVPSGTVDNPDCACAREYFSRPDHSETIDLSNQYIANMISATNEQLPKDLAKNIYETCKALNFSVPITCIES